jgi:hypothetical protein
MSTPAILVTTYGRLGFVSTLYRVQGIPAAILARIATLPDERCWETVCFGDVHEDPGSCVTRGCALQDAVVKLDLKKGIPKEFSVERVLVYDSPVTTSTTRDCRVVRLLVGVDGDCPHECYYLESRLPVTVLKRLREVRGHDIGDVYYKDVPYYGQDLSSMSKEEAASARALRNDGMARRDSELRAAEVQDVRKVNGALLGYSVVLETAYADVAEDGCLL